MPPPQAGKTVLRAGWGIFSDRFPIGNTLNTLRYNGSGQQDYNITSTSGNLSQAYAALGYFAAPGGIPPLPLLATANQPIYETDQNMKASYMMQSSSSIERALPGRNFGFRQYRSIRAACDDMRMRSINTFLHGTYDPATDTGKRGAISGSGFHLSL